MDRDPAAEYAAAPQLGAVLGGARALGRVPRSESELHARIREGLPFAALGAVMEHFEIPQESACRILNLSRRNFPRRRKSNRLAADESDRLCRLARVLAHAQRIFEDQAETAAWLRRPNPALRGETPLACLDTDIGVRQVEEILGRIEHGIAG